MYLLPYHLRISSFLPLGSSYEFAAAGCSAYLTTPLDVIKTRLQVQGSTSKYVSNLVL